jgi:hypothetical protein
MPARIINFPADRAGTVKFTHLVRRCHGRPRSCERVNSDGSDYVQSRMVGDGGGCVCRFDCGAALVLVAPRRLGKPIRGLAIDAPCPLCRAKAALPRGWKLLASKLPQPPEGITLRPAKKRQQKGRVKW